MHIEDDALATLLKAFDKDDNSSLDFEEFSALIKTHPLFNNGVDAGHGIADAIEKYPEWMGWLVDTFKYYDTDLSGCISKDWRRPSST